MDLGMLAAMDFTAGRFARGRAEHARAIALARETLEGWFFQQYVLAEPIEALLARGHVAEAARLLPPTVIAPGIGVAAAEVRLAEGHPREALAVLADLPPTDDPDLIWRSRLLAARAERRVGRSR